MTYGKPLTETPLKPAVFHILLALSQGSMHGLGIAGAVEEQTGGTIHLGPATLYRSLKEMTEEGLVAPALSTGSDDPRRKYYALTETGREMLGREAGRLARIVEVARQRAVIAEKA